MKGALDASSLRVEEAADGIAAFAVLHPGTYTTVQDLGRSGYAQFGVPASGALDAFSLEAANRLVGNPPDAAGLEVTQAGLALRVLTPTAIAATGGDLGLQINGVDAAPWCVQSVKPGDVVHFSERRLGVRAYLAVAGGISVPVVMGSRSTYVRGRLGGFHGRVLRRDDVLPVGVPSIEWRDRIGLSLPPSLRRFGLPQPVRVIPGPQEERFAPIALQRLCSAPYVVTPQSDRMGYRLQGPRLPYKTANDHVSDGIAPGSIQVPGDEQPIVLLADRQTTGGYPKIATVISADLDFLAHVWPGEPITFRRVDLARAYELRRTRQQLLAAVAQFARGI